MTMWLLPMRISLSSSRGVATYTGSCESWSSCRTLVLLCICKAPIGRFLKEGCHTTPVVPVKHYTTLA